MTGESHDDAIAQTMIPRAVAGLVAAIIMALVAEQCDGAGGAPGRPAPIGVTPPMAIGPVTCVLD